MQHLSASGQAAKPKFYIVMQTVWVWPLLVDDIVSVYIDSTTICGTQWEYVSMLHRTEVSDSASVEFPDDS